MKHIAARTQAHPRISNDTRMSRTHSHGRALALLLAVVCGVSLSGCASIGLFGMKHKAIPQADTKNPAVEVLAIWEPAEGRGANGVPTRGFAGQILFFNRQGASPVEVRGDVRVYLFDDRGSLEEQSKPIHQFDFMADAWKGHLKMSALGPSYHVFVPYVRKDHDQARCALRVRLKAADAPVIYSETANVVLPGPTSETLVAEEGGERDADEQFDNAAAKKLIAAGLQKKSAGTKREIRGRKNAHPSMHDEIIDPNRVVAMLELTPRGNELRAPRPASRAEALLAEDEYFPEDEADKTSHGVAPLEELPLEDAARIESPRRVVRLTPARQEHRPSTPTKRARRDVSLDEDDRRADEEFQPTESRSHHPLDDEEL